MLQKLAVFGLGYVGLSNAAYLSISNNVYGIDIDQNKIDLINKRLSPFSDKKLEHFLLKKNTNLKAIKFDKDKLKGLKLAIICMPTNYDPNIDSFDTSAIENVLKLLAECFPNINVVIKSTIPIGFVDQCNANHPELNIAFSPEFLREGCAFQDTFNPSRIVVGGNPKFFTKYIEMMTKDITSFAPKIITCNPKEAEAIKLFSNTYLAMRVGFFNELDNFALMHDMKSEDIIKGVSSDPRIGDFYNNPSFGYGGYCLPKDTKQLLSNFKGIKQKLITATVETNQSRKEAIYDHIMSMNINDIGIYRINMKSNSDNYRDSAIISIIESLHKSGKKVSIYEPNIDTKLFHNYNFINDIEKFKMDCDVILANRLDDEISDVRSKVFSRDIFLEN